MPQFTPSQVAALNQLYAESGANSIPGTWLLDGTVTFSKSTGFASAAQGARADTAYGWGNHASAGYASGTQGTHADTAYGWGDHAAEAYAKILKQETGTPSGGNLILAGSPLAGSALMVFQGGALIASTGYTYTALTKTLSGLSNVATIVLYLEG